LLKIEGEFGESFGKYFVLLDLNNWNCISFRSQEQRCRSDKETIFSQISWASVVFSKNHQGHLQRKVTSKIPERPFQTPEAQ
jgi:hypothetical protein